MNDIDFELSTINDMYLHGDDGDCFVHPYIIHQWRVTPRIPEKRIWPYIEVELTYRDGDLNELRGWTAFPDHISAEIMQDIRKVMQYEQLSEQAAARYVFSKIMFNAGLIF